MGKKNYTESINRKINNGDRFGSLVVVKAVPHEKGTGKHNLSLVKCDCGNEYVTRDTYLVTGQRDKCPACSRKRQIKHGLTDTRLFHIWQGMRARCNRKTNHSYKYYGEKGVSVCEEWDNSFEAFAEWAFANGYKDDLSIDRKDINDGYNPSNCRWADKYEQANNKSNTRLVMFEGEMQPVQKVARRLGIRGETIITRLNRGWTDEEAVDPKLYVNGYER